MNKKIIDLFYPSYNGKAIQKEIKKFFPADMSNRWIGQGKKVLEFEEKFGKKFNYKYCLALNSGSSALELAYHLIGLKKGDEVITPVLTCTATNIPLLRRNVKIIFADINKNLTINSEGLEDKITKKTKAIVAVTLGGLPIDNEVFKIAKQYSIPVVIDAAQSVGISEKRGNYICHSFQSVKHMTTVDGGALILRNKEEYNRAKRLRWFGIDREAKQKANWQPYEGRKMTMDIIEPGYKYQANDLMATIGLVNLEMSDKWLEYRKKIAKYYNNNLKCEFISGGSYWLYCILIDRRNEIAMKLRNLGIDTNMAHIRNDVFTVFGGKRLKDLKIMNELESKYLYIPINIRMTMSDAKYIVKTINSLL